MNIDSKVVAAADRWLDAEAGRAYQNQPLAQDWARLSKVAEELGEATAEMILATGQNPRKPHDPAARERLLKELADVVATGTLCIQHFTKDMDETEAVITASFEKLRQRVPTGSGYWQEAEERDLSEPKTPCPEGFYWIGQSLATCDMCGLPAWVHAGMAEPDSDTPFGDSGFHLKPWKPDEAEAIRCKWDPNYNPSDPITQDRSA